MKGAGAKGETDCERKFGPGHRTMSSRKQEKKEKARVHEKACVRTNRLVFGEKYYPVLVKERPDGSCRYNRRAGPEGKKP